MATSTALQEAPRTAPTPREIDLMVECFEEARNRAELADALYDEAKLGLIELVQQFGTVPAGAESSLRLQGARTYLTVTTSNTIAIKEDAVGKLKVAMEANDHASLFVQMFKPRMKHQLLKGAENKLRIAKLSARLVERYTKLYARCFDVNKKSPSLKAEHIDTAKPAKKGGR